MNGRPASLKAAIADFMTRQGIPSEMEQNLVKEAIHLHLLSALSEAGVLRHVAFQGGTALRLCYAGERYSEDLDFVCGKGGKYFDNVEFAALIQKALETTRRSLQREFGVDSSLISFKPPDDPSIVKNDGVAVAAWQIVVPVSPTRNSPRSRIRIEFANVPSYASQPLPVRATPGLVQMQDVILKVESPDEILADKAVAVVARAVLKFRDLWDVWFLKGKLDAKIDRDMIRRKFIDYGTADVGAKAEKRLEELAAPATIKAFLAEMKRFLPARRIAEITDLDLPKSILSESAGLVRNGVLAWKPH